MEAKGSPKIISLDEYRKNGGVGNREKDANDESVTAEMVNTLQGLAETRMRQDVLRDDGPWKITNVFFDGFFEAENRLPDGSAWYYRHTEDGYRIKAAKGGGAWRSGENPRRVFELIFDQATKRIAYSIHESEQEGTPLQSPQKPVVGKAAFELGRKMLEKYPNFPDLEKEVGDKVLQKP